MIRRIALGMRPLARPIALDGVALVWVVWTATRPAMRAGGGVPASILATYLPLALAAAAIVSYVLAQHLPAPARGRAIAAHFALYAVVPLMLFVRSRDTSDRPEVLGTLYVAAFALWTVGAAVALLRASAPLGDGRIAALLAAVLLVPFLAVAPYHRASIPTASDEPHYLVIVQSLLDDHTLDLKRTYDEQRYVAYYPDELPDRHVIHVGDAQYPIRDLGLPLLSLVPFAIGGRLGVLLFMCLVGAALAAQLYLACRDLGIARPSALLAVIVAMSAHPLLTYTSQVYPELVAALAFVTAARALRLGRATTPAGLAIASAWLGMLPWLSTRAWLIVLGAGIVLAYVALRPQGGGPRERALRIAAAALPFAALTLVLCYVNYRMFGYFIPAAGYFLLRDAQQVVAYAPQIGATGLLFDRVFGLLPHAPVYLLAALGAVPLLRGARTPMLAALALGWTAMFLYIADIAYWWADGSPPSRYLVAGLPFLVVLGAAGISALRSAAPAARAVAWGLVAYSALVACVFAVLPNLGYDLAVDVRAFDSNGAFFEFFGRLIRPNPASLFPSMVVAGPRDYALTAAWTAVLVVAIWLGARLASRPAPRIAA